MAPYLSTEVGAIIVLSAMRVGCHPILILNSGEELVDPATSAASANWAGDRGSLERLSAVAAEDLADIDLSRDADQSAERRHESVTRGFLDGPGLDPAVEWRLRLHAYPALGNLQLRSITPTVVRGWLSGLGHLAPSYQRAVYAHVSSVLNAAADDECIARNPMHARSVRAPKAEQRKVIPWPAEQVIGVHDSLAERYRIVATLAAGLGLRQGEVFGLSPDDVDFLRGKVEVQRQVKLFGTRLVFALPKGGKTRTVPLPGSVRDELAAYLLNYPAMPVELPWGHPEGEGRWVPLVLTSKESNALNRNYFNRHVWRPALKEAGIESARDNGMHALRHFYASTLLDAGESIKAVSDYLGHADPGFTLRTYTHLMPSSDERTRKAIDHALGGSVIPVSSEPVQSV